PRAPAPASHDVMQDGRASGARIACAVAAVGLLAVAIVAARVSTPFFLAAGAALVVLLAYGAYVWPRALLLTVALSPMVDQYVIGLLLPPDQQFWSRILSELLLAAVGLVVAGRALVAGTFVSAVRHPVTPLLAVFVLIGAVGAIANDVPFHVAAVGMLVTVDAFALFFLARMTPFDARAAAIAASVFVAAVAAAALVAVVQTVAGPQVVGLPFRVGTLGESVRAGSVFVDPGVLGAAAGAAAAFPLFAVFRVRSGAPRWAAIGVALLLLIAVVLTFSRGSWVGTMVGIGVVAVILDRRALALTVVLAVVAFAGVAVMPRNVLLPADEVATDTGSTPVASAEPAASARPSPAASATAAPPAPEAPDIIGSTIAKTLRVLTGSDARAKFVVNAIPIVADHPIVGVGPGRYGGVVASIFETPVHAQYGTDRIMNRVGARTVDNFWLHLVVEFGIAGLVVYLAIVGLLAVVVARLARRSAGDRFVVLAGTLGMLGVLTIHDLTSMLFEGNVIAFALWLFLGVCSSLPVAPAETGAAPP
ncbi:MAG: O-antigen ligase family protein, partial [Chloroflexota bacterium]|nr:O-antigen ligase family protein [Chloroflexota bacterium]